ncbi:hypothetical protein C3F09_00165 [candidate division GN15 bacterium]|uniref:Outer membrane protein beta-barrel domain-containing protein n=1 Tax=candidate division GN15 bacterium TaxID=2072418 RepID=A0A855X4P3_9BACT|nr:MAG: hypothetical protein C3F09_00165 [candidate division GN15 bacterium]
MRKFSRALAVVALCLLPVIGWTQEQAAEDNEKDFLEVNASAGIGMPLGAIKTWSDTLGAKSGVSGNFHIGYFLTSRVVLGAMFSYTQFGIDSNDPQETQHHRLYSPAVYLKYHFFGSSDLVPFVEASMGADFVKFSTHVYDRGLPKYRELGYEPGFGAGIAAGLHYYTSDNGGLFLQAGYHQGFTKNLTKTYGGNEYTFGENLSLFTVTAGIQVFFGSGQ